MEDLGAVDAAMFRIQKTDFALSRLVRNPEIVEVARRYGTTIRTCLPADPETRGGSEATVRIAKADLVPKYVNLRDHYKRNQTASPGPLPRKRPRTSH
ncbi:hypothetical protein OHA02_50785 [Streptomyces phaeochromogenes]|nr:hypothetical protein [Streptomyces phaeochromogenes]